MHAEIRQHVRHNATVNVLDGAFFGFALGVASFVTVIPLFVATLTDSTVLIGLIASIHLMGWQLPQLLTAEKVSRLRRYKRMVLLMTLHERWPFLGLAVVAALVPVLGRELSLILTFTLLIWQGLGGGLAATPWQTMIAKIMPSDWRGTFYGMQSSLANLMSSGGAVLAGAILGSVESPQDFALCFAIAGVSMGISFLFISSTREPESAASISTTHRDWGMFLQGLKRILRTDGNFRWFVVARILGQTAAVGIAFYTIYAVRAFDMDAETAGLMTGVMMLAQTVANPLLGWLGDRWSHRAMFALGAITAALSAVLALAATGIGWFYPIFALAGLAQATLWTTVMAMTVQFGAERDRPYYIGLSNTLVAPATLFAPIIGGWLADLAGFQATFMLAIVTGALTTLLLMFVVRDPRPERASLDVTPVLAAHGTPFGE